MDNKEDMRQTCIKNLVEMDKGINNLSPEDQQTVRRAIRDLLKLAKIYGENLGYMALLYSALKARVERRD